MSHRQIKKHTDKHTFEQKDRQKTKYRHSDRHIVDRQTNTHRSILSESNIMNLFQKCKQNIDLDLILKITHTVKTKTL